MSGQVFPAGDVRKNRSENRFDDMLVPLVRKSLKIFIVACRAAVSTTHHAKQALQPGEFEVITLVGFVILHRVDNRQGSPRGLRWSAHGIADGPPQDAVQFDFAGPGFRMA